MPSRRRPRRSCRPGSTSWNQATVKAGVGLGAIGLGALALGTGAYLYFTDRDEPAGPSAALSVGPNGVQVFGQF